ncbi:unnamed protein product [Effrenium voratum]|uniref:GTP binding protein second domain-containing protein n=1 Tax=Effrenium voratum TaxID=2562239 RepID=A0AA36NAJ5_9DINO|nr:unnamed protein product [Effrenium voratum]
MWYKMFNCDIIVHEDATIDDFIDVLEETGTAPRQYCKCIYVYNKIDMLSLSQVEELARQPFSVVISVSKELNLDGLLERIWQELDLRRVYTKKKAQLSLAPPFFHDRGFTMRACRSLLDDFKRGASGSFPAMAPAGPHAVVPGPREDAPKSPNVCLCLVGLVLFLYTFLLGLDFLHASCKALAAGGAAELLAIAQGPITGLTAGMLATALFQSSSPSTTILVGLVGSGRLAMPHAIPMIMGANIGTCVTNTLVSLAHIGQPRELEKAFSGATAHEAFNLLTTLVLLPLEVIVAAIQGEGGLLYWASRWLSTGGPPQLWLPGSQGAVRPLTEVLLSPDDNVLAALASGPPVSHATNASTCVVRSCRAFFCIDESVNCSEYYCLPAGTEEAWKQINATAFEGLLGCDSVAVLTPACGADSCYLNAGSFYTDQVADAPAQGFLAGSGAVLVLLLSFLLIFGSLFILVRLLRTLLTSSAKKAMLRATSVNSYLALGHLAAQGLALRRMSCCSAITCVVG